MLHGFLWVFFVCVHVCVCVDMCVYKHEDNVSVMTGLHFQSIIIIINHSKSHKCMTSDLHVHMFIRDARYIANLLSSWYEHAQYPYRESLTKVQ